jgi:hypothetical protein
MDHQVTLHIGLVLLAIQVTDGVSRTHLANGVIVVTEKLHLQKAATHMV